MECHFFCQINIIMIPFWILSFKLYKKSALSFTIWTIVMRLIYVVFNKKEKKLKNFANHIIIRKESIVFFATAVDWFKERFCSSGRLIWLHAICGTCFFLLSPLFNESNFFHCDTIIMASSITGFLLLLLLHSNCALVSERQLV